jgi:EAL and modified HD-GYP domain-containing signal transduction protein
LPEPLAAPLRDAGWRPLPVSRVFATDTLAPPPPEADWLAGDWALAPPSAKPAGGQAASRALALQLVERVNADADTHEIEDLLRRDATLSYHLLRLVNSLGMGAGRKVTSFSQAILILGRQQLRRWLNLMLFAAREGDVRSAMLLARVSVRARLMELLARGTGLDRHFQEQAFMVGMFSLLGALFGSPLADVLAPLAIGDALRAALLDRQGELGALLALVEAAERADFDTVDAALDALQLPPGEFNLLAAESTQWMLAVTQEVTARHA